MNSIDLSLYLVTNRKDMSFEQFFGLILESIKGGVTVVQLREKNTSFEQFVEIASALKSLLMPLQIPLIINDRIDVALASHADGVHLGQSDHHVKSAREILGKSAIIGLSIETHSQAIEAIQEPVDYIAVSPVFPTLTKLDCSVHLGIEGLKSVCAISPFPVIAIGGIDASNAHLIFDAGAKGVAVVSAIFDAPCPKTAAQKIREAQYGFSKV